MPEYRISVGWDVPIEIGPILFADKALRKSSFSYLLLAFRVQMEVATASMTPQLPTLRGLQERKRRVCVPFRYCRCLRSTILRRSELALRS